MTTTADAPSIFMPRLASDIYGELFTAEVRADLAGIEAIDCPEVQRLTRELYDAIEPTYRRDGTPISLSMSLVIMPGPNGTIRRMSMMPAHHLVTNYPESKS